MAAAAANLSSRGSRRSTFPHAMDRVTGL